MNRNETIMLLSLTTKQEKLIRKKAKECSYNSTNEVVRHALLCFLESKIASGDVPAKPTKEVVMKRLAEMELNLRARGFTSLALFGSVVRDAARVDSDIDVLVDMDNKALEDSERERLKLELQRYLEDEFARDVDVAFCSDIAAVIRKRVFAEAELIFP